MSSVTLHSASPQLQGETSPSQAADKPPAEDSYQYQPLPSHEHFRVLELLKDESIGGGRGEIRCSLHTERLSEAEDKYAAISYVWGDPMDRVPVVCDGRIIEVTINLADALRHIRDYTEHRFVWADAICINQQDNIEKGHQVKRMGPVYENAVEVVVWLGKDDEGIAEDCFNLIREANEYLDHQLEIFGHVYYMPSITREVPISFDKSRWEKLNKLARLPWFSRLWVLQEAALAKQCQLLWGEHQTTLAEACEIYLFLAHMAGLSNLVGVSIRGSIAGNFGVQCTYQTAKSWMRTKPLIKAILEQYQGSGMLLNVLNFGRYLNVSFDVDRVYAFLGNPLARKRDEQDLLVEPDYSKSAEQVYFEVACELIAHPREAPYLLHRVDHHESGCTEGVTLGADGALPSWVPRWDKNFKQYMISHSDYWYSAGGLGSFEATVQNDKSLRLPTIIFDSIVWISDTINSNDLYLDPYVWDEDTKTSQQCSIDRLFTSVQQAFYLHCPDQNSEILANSMSTQDAFTLTMVQHSPDIHPDNFDLIRHQQDFSAYIQAARQLVDTLTKDRMSVVASKWPSQLKPSAHDIGNTSPFRYERKLPGSHNRRFAITKSGRFALVPWLAQPMDMCCICPGTKVPLILRPREDGRYGLAGDSYIHGVMKGEVMEQLEKGEVKLENIVLV